MILAFGNLLGAFGSLFAGLADRWGRANLVVGGLLVTGVFVGVHHSRRDQQVGVRHRDASWSPSSRASALVATPALIRDFSPQVGRATAMGFWTSGPVLGSLIVAVVGSATIPAVVPDTRFWTHEFLICGIAGLVVFVIALVGLQGAGPATARPAHGDDARPGADRGPGQGRSTSRRRCATRSGSCSSATC